jgi:pimeloyl-ACP methyl ester carboxylesterase
LSALPPELCHYTIEGQPNGPSLVFIHGWPDDTGLWHQQVTALGHRYRCVLITLPNFGEQRDSRPR